MFSINSNHKISCQNIPYMFKFKKLIFKPATSYQIHKHTYVDKNQHFYQVQNFSCIFFLSHSLGSFITPSFNYVCVPLNDLWCRHPNFVTYFMCGASNKAV